MNGQLLSEGNEQVTARDENRKVQFGNQPNLSGKENKGVI
jgi:hypothetical protein